MENNGNSGECQSSSRFGYRTSDGGDDSNSRVRQRRINPCNLPQVEDMVAIIADIEYIGQTISSSKVRYSWILESGGKPARVEFIHSRVTGKKKVLFNGECIHQSSHIKASRFQLTWQVNKHIFLLMPDPEGIFQLRIDGIPFRKLIRTGNMREKNTRTIQTTPQEPRQRDINFEDTKTISASDCNNPDSVPKDVYSSSKSAIISGNIPDNPSSQSCKITDESSMDLLDLGGDMTAPIKKSLKEDILDLGDILKEVENPQHMAMPDIVKNPVTESFSGVDGLYDLHSVSTPNSNEDGKEKDDTSGGVPQFPV